MKNSPEIAVLVMLSLMASLICPTLALADKGSGSSSGSGRGSDGNSGDSGSSGSSGTSGKSGSSGDSGSSDSGHSDTSGDDHSGRSSESSGNHEHGSAEHRSERQENVFSGGWRERLHVGQYEVVDPDGRLVIRRPPTDADLRRFKSKN